MKKISFGDKQRFREYCKKKNLNHYAINTKIKREKLVTKKLTLLIKESKVKNVLLYIPLETEVNILHLFKSLRGKVNIYVPFMEGVSFKMVKFRLPLFKKNFNIKEPKNSLRKISKLD